MAIKSRQIMVLCAVMCLCWQTVGSTAEPDWLWDAPREHFNCVTCKADPGGGIIQNPMVAMLDGSNLVMLATQNVYKSDAVVEDVKTRWQVSRDGGRIWERSEPILPTVFPTVEVGRCARFAYRLPDGTLLAAGSYGWENFPDTPENRKKFVEQGLYFLAPEDGHAEDTLSISHRAWMQQSVDDGRTWEERQIQLPVFVAHLCWYGGGVVLKDGSFVQPMWGRFDLKKEPKYVSSLLLRTEDKGESWTIHTIAGPKDFDLNETSVAQAANGDLVALIRTGNQKELGGAVYGQKELWTALSSDGGKTWTPARDSGLRGSTPWVVTTKDGLIVAVYIRRAPWPTGGGFPETGVFACVSRDHGQTWDTEHQVMLVDGGGEMVGGYPSAVALPDGSVYAVYALGACHGARHREIGGTRFHPRWAAFGASNDE